GRRSGRPLRNLSRFPQRIQARDVPFDLGSGLTYAATVSAGQAGCLSTLDPSIEYTGPRAAFATLGGSPTWGLGDRFHEFAAARGRGDLGLPKSYLPRAPMPTGLPGTELEFCLPRQVAIMDDPFCPPLAEVLRADAERQPDFRFRRIHGPDAGVVLNRWLAGN